MGLKLRVLVEHWSKCLATAVYLVDDFILGHGWDVNVHLAMYSGHIVIGVTWGSLALTATPGWADGPRPSL